MVHVEIEYCVACGFVDSALDVQWALLEEFGQQLDGVQLSPGDGGVFEVHVDGETIWDDDVHGTDVDVDLVIDAVAERVETTA